MSGQRPHTNAADDEHRAVGYAAQGNGAATNGNVDQKEKYNHTSPMRRAGQPVSRMAMALALTPMKGNDPSLRRRHARLPARWWSGATLAIVSRNARCQP